MTYEKAIAYISSLQKRGWRLGLDRILYFLSLIDSPQQELKFFHVAGTNGKGSVTAMLQSVLFECGYNVGAFYSPYVYDFRERIQCGKDFISKKDVARLTEYLIPHNETMEKTEFEGLTEFEFKTAMGFLFWKEKKCDHVCLETGLGGRLDATNVVNPLVSIITEIGLDHTQHLGNTIEEITREKAGIIKPNTPVVTGVTNKNCLGIIQKTSAQRKSPLWALDKNVFVESYSKSCDVVTPKSNWKNLTTNLIGEHQHRNLALCISALEITDTIFHEQQLRKGLNNVSLPGRFEVISQKPIIVLDGAHNPQSISALLKTVQENYPNHKVKIIYSASTGHDIKGTVCQMVKTSSDIMICEMNHNRRMSLIEMKNIISIYDNSIKYFTTSQDALQHALSNIKQNELLLITGSFYLLSEIKQHFDAMK